MLKVGIVGLPNVGKSTLFNAILKREQALSANYPFATIEPNIGVVDVVDKRLDTLAKLVAVNEMGAPKNILHIQNIDSSVKLPPIVYANIEFVDIAGLVEGANKGEGLGNQFLANIREVDMIIQVVRDFSDPNIVREHSKNPDVDSDVINSELIYKDLESIEKKLKVLGNDTKKSKEINILNIYFEHLNKGFFALDINPNKNDNTPISKEDYYEFIKPLFLLTDKEMIYVFNVDDPSVGSTPNLSGDSQQNITKEYKERPVIYISAKLESELSSLSNEDQKAYLQELGIAEAGLDKITRACFNKLGLISYFTAGVKEVRAWEIKKESNALVAAGRIHTDFMKNFIKAEVIAYEDYVKYGTKLLCKEAGRLRLEGKEYIVKDGDVIEFKIGA
ncbi:redox-regulated ATPase YchF [candidate division WWE3 bacterium CG10_big_fil_rev_8_21_14_0_10_32_10]|uniref:Redox-regulated ATPase YchF n=1 Tax=candidate division WWE3 bacterium CG10_big_fil_rev_8_21_14_0_10_32_10 TaxID=1975090 RepID=A0A2H0R9D1_UNCKA|nr:MAG: redox-regulated ATPase YchF [candidate division WWE3 bacterium CG10_big_fil_rev_8_21_14_0_10_32_10]